MHKTIDKMSWLNFYKFILNEKREHKKSINRNRNLHSICVTSIRYLLCVSLPSLEIPIKKKESTHSISPTMEFSIISFPFSSEEISLEYLRETLVVLYQQPFRPSTKLFLSFTIFCTCVTREVASNENAQFHSHWVCKWL